MRYWRKKQLIVMGVLGRAGGIFWVLVLDGRLQDEGCTRLWISNKLQAQSL
jgi:hypothetical protein